MKQVLLIVLLFLTACGVVYCVDKVCNMAEVSKLDYHQTFCINDQETVALDSANGVWLLRHDDDASSRITETIFMFRASVQTESGD